MSATTSSSAGTKLSARRGSLAAPDPFALNTDVNQPKGQTSRLTIIRAPSSLEGSSPLGSEFEEGTTQKSRMRSHTSGSTPQRARNTPSPLRIGTRASGSPHAGSDASERTSHRMSFARSSFLPEAKQTIGGGSTPESAPSRSESSSSPASFLASRNSPDSNTSFQKGRRSTFQTRRHSLAPQQIWDLAQTSLKSATGGETSDSSPHLSEGSSPLFYTSHEVLPRDAGSGSPNIFSSSPAPFTPLPATHYLPFVDRPSEIAALLSSDANSRFMALLKQIFPAHRRDALANPDELDPKDWPFPLLVSYLTETPRSKYPDKIWTTTVRHCIRARSEVVWERFKEILGVPAELDTDEFIESDNDDESGRETSDSDDEEEAWVEPLYPSSSPLSPISPAVGASTTADLDEGGLAYGSRAKVMETIGEGEEEANIVTVSNTRTNSFERSHSAECIRGLRLHTRQSLENGLAMSLERESSTDLGAERPLTRSLSEGYVHRVAPLPSGRNHRSQSLSKARRTSIGLPGFERGPGNPLFPSNFGRLSIGPTLPANNPLLYNQAQPIPSTYSFPGKLLNVPASSGLFRQSRSSGSDYALALTSESEGSPGH